MNEELDGEDERRLESLERDDRQKGLSLSLRERTGSSPGQGRWRRKKRIPFRSRQMPAADGSVQSLFIPG
jgi:hypothetical protein